MTTLTTERLTLSPYTAADFADCATMWADPDVTRFIGGQPFTEEDSWARVLRYAGLWSLIGHGVWAVRETSTGRFVGDVGFVNFHRAVTPAFGETPEAAWALSPWAQGRGLAREALLAGLDWIEGTFGANRTVCMIDPANLASTILAERAGYRRYGETTYKAHPVTLFEKLRPA